MTPHNMEEDSYTIEHRIFDFLKFVLVKKKIIFISYGISILFALVYIKTVQKEYKSSLTGFSNYLKANQVKHIVSDLQLLLKVNRQDEVAKKLNLPLTQVKHLKSIEVLDHSELYKKITEDDLNFQVNVIVTDLEILDSLENSLTSYISNINFVRKRLKLDITDLTDERDVLNNEIRYIDSAKFLLLGKINSADNKGIILSNLGEVISTKMELDKKLKDNEKKLRFIEDFQVVKSFDKSYNKSFPKGSVVLPIVLGITTVFLYLYFFSLKIFKYFKD